MNVVQKYFDGREGLTRNPRGAAIRPNARASEALEKSFIAELSAAAIANMTREEMLRVIRAAELPVVRCSDLSRSLPFYNRETLVRLAHLARRCCQNQAHVHESTQEENHVSL